MKHTNLIVLILAILFVVACKDNSKPFDGEYELTIKVIDQVSKKPVMGATTGVLEVDREDFSGWGAQTVGAGRTDEDGIFTLKFKAAPSSYLYKYTAKADQYFQFQPRSFSLSKSGKSTEIIEITPYGYLKLHVVGNKGGFEMSGSISTGMGNGGIGPFYRGYDTTEVNIVKPAKECRITYWIYDNRDSVLKHTSIYLSPPSPHDTIYHKIEF